MTPAIRKKNETEYWSKKLDSTSAEDARASIQSFLGIDTDEPDHVNEPQEPGPHEPAERFTMWDI
jgi:hypothetical protein